MMSLHNTNTLEWGTVHFFVIIASALSWIKTSRHLGLLFVIVVQSHCAQWETSIPLLILQILWWFILDWAVPCGLSVTASRLCNDWHDDSHDVNDVCLHHPTVICKESVWVIEDDSAAASVPLASLHCEAAGRPALLSLCETATCKPGWHQWADGRPTVSLTSRWSREMRRVKTLWILGWFNLAVIQVTMWGLNLCCK